MDSSQPSARNSARPALGGAWLVAVCVLAAAGVALRLHNGWHFPALGSYDAYSHFTYIWHLAETGRVPLPSEGWSYFHPPLYYAFMAAIWNLLSGSDPLVRLRVGTEAIALLGCLHAFFAWRIARRRFADDARIAAMTGLYLLFVPVMAYSAGFLGNEQLHAVIGSVSLVALLAVLRKPTAAGALALGACLGLAMLAKFSAVTIVTAAFATLALRCLFTRDFAGGPKMILTSAAVMLAVCGPYYARNVRLYGTPFEMARTATFMTAFVENNQPQAARTLADYLTFDLQIFRRPTWPRGQTPDGDPSPYGLERSMRESVWTGLYANTWFDGFGGWVLPPVTESEASRRAGQALLTLAIVPTLLVLLGLASGVTKLRRDGWDDEIVSFALAIAAMTALLVYGTTRAPIAASVKATYFIPVCLAFAFFFSLGLKRVRDAWPRMFRAGIGVCAVIAVLGFVVFWQGLVFDPATYRNTLPGYEAGRDVQYGIVEYAGGRVAEARERFEQASAGGSGLGDENLAFLAIDAGKPREGLRLLRRAAARQAKSDGAGPIARERFHALTAAEYQHSIAVVLYALGRRDRAAASWTRALQNDSEHAEALWCLTLARLENDLASAGDAAARSVAFEKALDALENVRALDPGLEAGWRLKATVEAARGDCDAARHTAEQWQRLPWWIQPRYPQPGGNGAGLAASIGRRRLIPASRPELGSDGAVASCGARFS